MNRLMKNIVIAIAMSACCVMGQGVTGLQSIPFEGTIKITTWIDAEGQDLTPSSNQSTGPARMVLNQTEAGIYYLTASQENYLFNLGENVLGTVDPNGNIVFDLKDYSYLGSSAVVDVLIILQITPGGNIAGTFKVFSTSSDEIVEGILALSTPDQSTEAPFNGSFVLSPGTFELVAESGSVDLAEDLKNEALRFSQNVELRFVQVGDLVSFVWSARTTPKKSQQSFLFKMMDMMGFFPAAGKSGLNETYFLPVGMFIAAASGNSVTFMIDDKTWEIGGVEDDPFYNKFYRFAFTISEGVLSCVLTIHEEILAETEEEQDEIAEISAELDLDKLDDTLFILEVETDPDPPIIKTSKSATFRVKVKNHLNKLVKDYSSNVRYELMSNSTKGIARMSNTILLIDEGKSDWNFIFTPEKQMETSSPITTQTVLSGTVYVTVTPEDSRLKPVRLEIHVKSPFDYYVDEVEIQQGVMDADKEVWQEYSPGVFRTYPALPFIAEHNTAVSIFVKFNETVPLAYSEIEGIEGVLGRMTITHDGAEIFNQSNLKCGGYSTRTFVLKEEYDEIERETMRDGFFVYLPYTTVADPGTYSFDVELYSDGRLDEVVAEQANNQKDAIGTFVGTNFLRILPGRAGATGEGDPPEIPVSHLDFIPHIYPMQHSRLHYQNSELNRIYYFTPGFLHRFSYGPYWRWSSGILNRFNQNNPGDQREKLVLFADEAFIQTLAGKKCGGFALTPLFGASRITINNVIEVSTPAHELGHTLGLRDTYKTEAWDTEDGDPNPRRSDATNNGNFIEDGNIQMVNKERSFKAFNPIRDFMGGGGSRWTDRTVWDYLYRSKFALSSPSMQKSHRNGSYITVSGMIDSAGSASFFPFIEMTAAPEVDESFEGPYSLEFRDAGGSLLNDFTFDVMFHISEIGDVTEMPFLFYLPLNDAIRTVLLKLNGAVLATQTISDNAPEITLLSPTEGDTLKGKVPIRWSASDADGDSLSFDLLYSPDGEYQTVLNVGIAETSYELNVDLFDGGAAPEITVIASDGVNESRAVLRNIIVSVDNNDFRGIPVRFMLLQNYPNPFNPNTTIEYSIPKSVKSQLVKLMIFNLLGEKIRTLVNKKQNPGYYSVQWDSRTDSGKSVPSGLYIYQLQAGSVVEMKKMLFSK